MYVTIMRKFRVHHKADLNSINAHNQNFRSFVSADREHIAKENKFGRP